MGFGPRKEAFGLLSGLLAKGDVVRAQNPALKSVVVPADEHSMRLQTRESWLVCENPKLGRDLMTVFQYEREDQQIHIDSLQMLQPCCLDLEQYFGPRIVVLLASFIIL